MATRNDSTDDLLLSSVVVLAPLLTLLGVAYVIERHRRRQSVFRPGQEPPQPELGMEPMYGAPMTGDER